VALANSIAYVSELIDPVSIFLGLTRKNMTEQSLNYIVTGQGETGLMVYQILVRYWEWTAEEDVRPLIFLLSD
jgi:repressor of nif and glnA expression